MNAKAGLKKERSYKEDSTRFRNTVIDDSCDRTNQVFGSQFYEAGRVRSNNPSLVV